MNKMFEIILTKKYVFFRTKKFYRIKFVIRCRLFVIRYSLLVICYPLIKNIESFMFKGLKFNQTLRSLR